MPAHVDPEAGTTSTVKRNYSDANLYEPLEGLNPPSAALFSTSAVLVPPSASLGEDRTVKEAQAKKSKTCSTSTLATNPKEFLFVADTCQGWIIPENNKYNGLLVKRPLVGIQPYQPWVDRVGASKAFGSYDTVEAPNIRLGGSREDLLVQLQSAAAQMLADATEKAGQTMSPEDSRMPAELASQLSADVCDIGMAVAALCPASPTLQIKLEVIGENSCARWHRDSYVGRAIVSYTGVDGTLFTPDSNVNEDALELHSGPIDTQNRNIIRDQRAVKAAGLGDICFMKGLGYPTGAKGLVHKAADKKYHADGGLVYRLALKVDVPLNRVADCQDACCREAHGRGHGHGHAGGGHADAHGHSHGGVPCSGHGEPCVSYDGAPAVEVQDRGHGHGDAGEGDAAFDEAMNAA